jgi:hypothetical protein
MQAAKHDLYPRTSATCNLRPGWWWGEKHRGAIAGEQKLPLLNRIEHRKQNQAKYLSALLELGYSGRF